MEELLSQLTNRTDQKERRRSVAHLLALLPHPMRRLAIFCGVIFLITSFIILARQNDRLLVEIPKNGGTLTEGIIGRPRFINPVIARSDADRDLVELVYSGLLRSTSDNQFVPDLARSYEISPDGLVYTFILRDNLVWHDGEPITSADIAFTIEKARDQGLAIKSPKRASWEGVTVETPDPKTVIFRIKQTYAPFLENATMGILPKHIWEKVPNDEFDVTYHNVNPIGSGPYRIETIVQDNARGLPSHYNLVAFQRYSRGEPYITNLRIFFYGNNAELSASYNKGVIDQMHTVEPALAHELVRAGAHIEQAQLPRVFAAYFNQNQQPIFADLSVRKALRMLVDKDRIVADVLLGYGRAIDEPLPFGKSDAPTLPLEERIARARKLLEDGGWKIGEAGLYEKTDKKKKTTATLEFSISVPDVLELRNSAEMLRANWEQIGAKVTVKVFEPTIFSADVLAPRKYDVLFFGQVIGRTPDLFAYWHSSQRHAPGLNVALYANTKADKFLEQARQERDDATRADLLGGFLKEVASDIPAIFVYSPDFLYATGKQVKGIHTEFITTEAERFLGVENWYIESERVWEWFANRQEAKRAGINDSTI